MTEATTLDGTKIMRHTIATLAFRGAKVFEELPSGFADFSPGEGVMTPIEIVNHVSTILGFAHARLTGAKFEQLEKLDWDGEEERFFHYLSQLDEATTAGYGCEEATMLTMLQGPILDAFTHIGQLSTLRRLAGSPTPPAHYIKADIQIGRVGKEQAE